MSNDIRHSLTRVSFRRIKDNDSEFNARVSRAFSLLFDEISKEMIGENRSINPISDGLWLKGEFLGCVVPQKRHN